MCSATHRLRGGIPRVAAAALGAAACLIGPAGFAGAAFDADVFAMCTSTSPNPDGNFDAVVTTCCVDQGGTPTPSSYGLGCVGAVPDPMPVDYRPLIVMPTPPLGPDGMADDVFTDELIPLPPGPLP